MTALEVARHKHCAIHRVPQRVKIEQAARRATGKISGAHRGRNGILLEELFERGGDSFRADYWERSSRLLAVHGVLQHHVCN